MTPERRAVIDVGTNSAKLLVAEVAGNGVHPIYETGVQTRLGERLGATRQLQPNAIARTVSVVTDFVATARTRGAQRVRLFATSAAREATNGQDLVAALRQAVGLPLEIISGLQEATWAFQGARTHPQFARGPLLLLEVGGGSTQCVFGLDDQVQARVSIPVGAVRLLERFSPSDPPQPEELSTADDWLKDFLRRELHPVLAPALQQLEREQPAPRSTVQSVGVGGTAVVLARMEMQRSDYNRERIEATRLSRACLAQWVSRLWTLPRVARQSLPGLPAERADIILTGALIYQAVTETLDFRELRVCTRGLRFAAVAGAE